MTDTRDTTPDEQGLGRGLEAALLKLASVDEHLRRLDEHVRRARAAERRAIPRGDVAAGVAA